MPQKGTRRAAKEKIKRVHKPFETNADCIKATRTWRLGKTDRYLLL